MALINATFASGNFISIGAFGISNVSARYVSPPFLNIAGSNADVFPSFQLLRTNFVGTQQLNINAFGLPVVSGQFVSPSEVQLFTYIPIVLPLTVGTGEGPTTATRYWLS